MRGMSSLPAMSRCYQLRSCGACRTAQERGGRYTRKSWCESYERCRL